MWFCSSISDRFSIFVSSPSLMPSIKVPTFVSFSLPPSEHPIFVLVCSLNWGGSSSISELWIVSSISISKDYWMIFAFSGLVEEISCSNLCMNSSASCWVPKGWNSGCNWRNRPTKNLGVTSFLSISLMMLDRELASAWDILAFWIWECIRRPC